MNSVEGIESYGLIVPAQWTSLPVNEGNFDRFREKLVTQLDAFDGVTATQKRQMGFVIDRLKHDAAAANITYIAAYFEAFPPTDDAEATVLSASCTLSTVKSSSFDVPFSITPEVLLASFSTSRPTDKEAPGFSLGLQKSVEVEPPAIVELPIGRAVRLRRLEDFVLNTGPMTAYNESYFTPVADGAAVCLLQFSTPSFEEARPLSRLFEAIAKTLRAFAPGDETSFDGPSDA